MPAVVSDSSPFIYLTHLGRFDLLRTLFATVLVPSAVWMEVGVHGAGRPEATNLRAAVDAGWIEVVAATVRSPAHAGLAHLGIGEREAIQLAYERQALLVIDEAEGREIALQLGLKLTGTLGLLVEAKNRGVLNAVRPEIERLMNESNFRISDQVRRHILKLAGEA